MDIRLALRREVMEHTPDTASRYPPHTVARRRRNSVSLEQQPERVVLVGFSRKSLEHKSKATRVSADEALEELVELAVSAGADVQARIVQSRDVIDAATLIGSGKVRELADLVAASHADSVIFAYDLTPTQQRNLENKI